MPLYLLIAVLCMPFFQGSSLYDGICIILVIPLILALGASVTSSDRAACRWLFLGANSYPFYILHMPMLHLSHWPYRAAHGYVPSSLVAAAALLATAGLAHLCRLRIDEPIRAMLSRNRWRLSAAQR